MHHDEFGVPGSQPTASQHDPPEAPRLLAQVRKLSLFGERCRTIPLVAPTVESPLMSAEQVALVPQCEECLASNDPLTSHPWRLAVGETLVGRSLFRHVDYFGGPGARRRWGETGGL